MTSYQRIVFLQGEEADEALSILDVQGWKAAMAYLADWDYGDICDTSDEPSSGSSDEVFIGPDGLRLSCNRSLGYIGLERKFKHD